jgi:hypothetical protein
MRCPEDAAVIPGFSSGGFGTSPRQLIKGDVEILSETVKLRFAEKGFPGEKY